MLKRTLTGMILVLFSAPFIIFSNTYALSIYISALCAMSTFEMLRCIGTLKNPLISAPILVVAASFPILAKAIDNINYFTATYFASLMAALFLMLAAGVFSQRTDVVASAVTFSLCMYIITGFVSIVLLREEEGGSYYFLMPIIASFTCDIFAYLIGRALGKHKLIPKVSPKKTVEGSIGGIVFCALICLGYGLILRHAMKVDDILPAWTFIVGGTLIAILSQIGDLVASVIKRKYGVKDYGKILPGHGGILDRFDSVIPTAPVFLILIVILKKVL